jgi:hypothetical protein
MLLSKSKFNIFKFRHILNLKNDVVAELVKVFKTQLKLLNTEKISLFNANYN